MACARSLAAATPVYDDSSPVNNAFNELARNTLLVVGALFPIVNPLGNTPIFLTLTHGLSASGRARLARSIALNGLALMVVSIFIGTYILTFFGISLPMVQVGGGLVVISTGWALLRRPDDDGADEDTKEPCHELHAPGFLSVDHAVDGRPGFDRGVHNPRRQP